MDARELQFPDNSYTTGRRGHGVCAVTGVTISPSGWFTVYYDSLYETGLTWIKCDEDPRPTFRQLEQVSSERFDASEHGSYGLGEAVSSRYLHTDCNGGQVREVEVVTLAADLYPITGEDEDKGQIIVQQQLYANGETIDLGDAAWFTSIEAAQQAVYGLADDDWSLQIIQHVDGR